jgi:hypothetical protein
MACLSPGSHSPACRSPPRTQVTENACMHMIHASVNGKVDVARLTCCAVAPALMLFAFPCEIICTEICTAH